MAQRILHHGFALLVMTAGCGLLFGLLIAMNDQQGPRKDAIGKQTMQVVVEREKKPPRTRRRPEPRRQRRRSSRTAAPRPNLAASLTGNAFGIPELEGAAGLDGMSAEALDTEQAVRDMVMTEAAVDRAPQPTRRSSPVYPPRARSKGITGKVVLGLLIDDGGRVVRVKVLESSPPGVFEQAATEAVRSWLFQPARYQTQAVKVWARQTVHFQLS